MRILLLKEDGIPHACWASRLSTPDSATSVIVEDRTTYAEKHKYKAFALGLAFWDSSSTWSKADVDELRSRCERIICVSANDSLDEVEVAYTFGFDDFLTESCTEVEIASKVRQALHAWQVQQRLDQALKLESIGELAAGIAHEINTPIQYVGDNTRFVRSACDDLISVLSACQDVLTAADESQHIGEAAGKLRDSLESADADYLVDEVPSAIAQTLEGVDRVSSIVRAMKEFAHPGVSEMTLTDLSQAIDTTVMIARNEWKYVAEIETDFDETLPPVPCLPGEMNQVILNLIVNASHAIKDALQENTSDKGKISISTKLQSPYAEIRVSDTGTGISPENMERIFAPFFTTKSAGKGTGQGLALAHSVIVEKHLGTLDVESELGRGTTFVLRIPLEQTETNASLTATATA